MTIGTYSSAPEADFASTPVASGLWRAVVTTAVTAKPAAGAQDRADIVRIGDLVEHQHDARRRDVLELGRGQGIGFGQQPLCTASGPSRRAIASGAPARAPRRRHAIGGKAARGVLGGVETRMRRAGLSSAAFTVCQP